MDEFHKIVQRSTYISYTYNVPLRSYISNNGITHTCCQCHSCSTTHILLENNNAIFISIQPFLKKAIAIYKCIHFWSELSICYECLGPIFFESAHNVYNFVTDNKNEINFINRTMIFFSKYPNVWISDLRFFENVLIWLLLA